MQLRVCSFCSDECAGEQESRMGEARLEIEAKWQKRMEREKDRVSEKLLDSMDKEGRAEMVDNGWLKREVRTLTGLSLQTIPVKHFRKFTVS